MKQETKPNRPSGWAATALIWNQAEADMIRAGTTSEAMLTKLAAMPVAERLARLEARDLTNWKVFAKLAAEAINSVPAGEDAADAEALPEITSHRTFALYVSLVASRLHRKLITGPEARAMLYAAQLALSALKGAKHDAAKPE